MKKLLYLLMPLLFMVSGCRNTTEVDGEHYSMLTVREESELVVLARETLVRNAPKLISQPEAGEVKRIKPEVRIEYRGDCAGEAVISWDLPARRLEVVIDGELNETSPFRRNVMVRIMKKHDGVLDFRKGDPR